MSFASENVEQTISHSPSDRKYGNVPEIEAITSVSATNQEGLMSHYTTTNADDTKEILQEHVGSASDNTKLFQCAHPPNGLPEFHVFCPPKDPSKVCFICKLPPKRPTDSYRIANPDEVQKCFMLPIPPPESGRICARHYHLLRLYHSDTKKLFPFEHCRALSDRKRIVCSLADESLQPKDPTSNMVAFVMNLASANVGPTCEFYISCKSLGPPVDAIYEDGEAPVILEDVKQPAQMNTRSKTNQTYTPDEAVNDSDSEFESSRGDGVDNRQEEDLSNKKRKAPTSEDDKKKKKKRNTREDYPDNPYPHVYNMFAPQMHPPMYVPPNGMMGYPMLIPNRNMMPSHMPQDYSLMYFYQQMPLSPMGQQLPQYSQMTMPGMSNQMSFSDNQLNTLTLSARSLSTTETSSVDTNNERPPVVSTPTDYFPQIKPINSNNEGPTTMESGANNTGSSLQYEWNKLPSVGMNNIPFETLSRPASLNSIYSGQQPYPIQNVQPPEMFRVGSLDTQSYASEADVNKLLSPHPLLYTNSEYNSNNIENSLTLSRTGTGNFVTNSASKDLNAKQNNILTNMFKVNPPQSTSNPQIDTLTTLFASSSTQSTSTVTNTSVSKLFNIDQDNNSSSTNTNAVQTNIAIEDLFKTIDTQSQGQNSLSSLSLLATTPLFKDSNSIASPLVTGQFSTPSLSRSNSNHALLGDYFNNINPLHYLNTSGSSTPVYPTSSTPDLLRKSSLNKSSSSTNLLSGFPSLSENARQYSGLDMQSLTRNDFSSLASQSFENTKK